MTDFTREWIAKREQREQAATEGPWYDMAGVDWVARVGGGGLEVADTGKAQDAEFIADARTSLPAALAALRAVLEETDGRKRHYGHALLDGDHCSACLAADIRAAVEAALRGES